MEDEIKDNPQSFLEQVRQEREALEKANSEMKQLILQAQEIKAVEILSGKSDAGKQQKEKPVEKSNADYAKDALKGIV
jgi:hypothetical protein